MKKWNVLVIGAGNIASDYDDMCRNEILSHAHAISVSNYFELLGFYDLDYEKARRAAKKWNTKAFMSLEGLDQETDIVCCAVPDEYHYDILKEIMGWNSLSAVICEKPLAKKIADGKNILDLYTAKRIPLFINYSRRFLQAFQKAKEWINYNAGELIVGNCFYGKGTIHNSSHLVNLFQFLLGRLEIDSVGECVNDFFDDDVSRQFVLKHSNKKIYFHPIPCYDVTIFEFDLMFINGRMRYSDEKRQIEYYNVAESSIYRGEQNYVLTRVVDLDSSAAMQGLYDNIRLFLCKEEKVLSDVFSAYETLNICDKIVRGEVCNCE